MKNELHAWDRRNRPLRGQIKDGPDRGFPPMKTLFKKPIPRAPCECKTYYDGNKAQFASEKRIRPARSFFSSKKEMSATKKKAVSDKAKKVLARTGVVKRFYNMREKILPGPERIHRRDVGWFKKATSNRN